MSPEPSEGGQSTSQRALARAATTKAWLEAHDVGPGSPVALVTDERLLLHAGPSNHPERPARLAEILKQLEISGLSAACVQLSSREATQEELLRVHSQEHIDQVFNSASSKKKGKAYGTPFGPDTYANDETPLCASLSTGCLLSLVDKCLEKGDGPRCGFAAIRPPGHHATVDKASGFCMFNNVAVAVRQAQQVHGLKRVAVVDWDVHHGNGTNDIFEKDESVLFFSLHRYDSYFFPGTGFVEDVGKAEGRGYNVNCPLDKGFGDLDVAHVMRYLICPLMEKFEPEAIFISAGFDAVRGDPLGECRVSPEGFGWLTRGLYRLAKHYCEGRLFLALEGGYSPDLIAQCTVECVRTLLAEVHGLAGPELEDPVPATPMSSLPTTPAMGPSVPASPSLSSKSGRSEGVPAHRPLLVPDLEGSPPASPSASPALSASGRKARGPAGKTCRAVRKATELLQVLPMDVPLAPQAEGVSKNAKRNERRRSRKHSEEDGASSDSSGWAIAYGGDPEFSFSPAMRMVVRQVSSSSHTSHDVPDMELPPPVVLPRAEEVATKEPPSSAPKSEDVTREALLLFW
ncbi:unnamed protein product [Durusdinium trenchii]